MKNVAKLSIAGAVALLFSSSAFAGPNWFETESFRKTHTEWAPKFDSAYKAYKATEEAVKTAQAAVKLEKDKAKRAELQKTVPAQAHRDTRTAWLKLHLEWKPYELSFLGKKWDDKTAAIKAAIDAKKGVAKELWDARVKLYNAELTYLDAQREWQKAATDFQTKRWTEELEKLAAASAKK
ncbi:MAG: hypothetical protein NTZ16_16160 [Verrucomicrobia bacterium]|nr:hypothetical protein [Verrucomicrobiota bacterium]